MVDDIIGTLLKFHEFAEQSGAQKTIALITHGVLTGGIRKAKKALAKIYLANTINREEANADITDLIINSISQK